MDMRRLLAAALLGVVLLAGAGSAPTSGSVGGGAGSTAPGGGQPGFARVREALARLPLGFEPDPSAPAGTSRFRASASGYGVTLSEGGDAAVGVPAASGGSAEGVPGFGMRLAGTSARPPGRGRDPLPGKRNYFVGADRGSWRTDVQTYGAVVYDGVYRGVDLVYHGQAPRNLQYDFVLAPGVDAGVIDVVLEGAESLALESGGDLVIRLAAGTELRMARPVVYQEVDGSRRPVAGEFVLRGPEPPVGAGDTGPERPVRAGDTGSDRVGFSVGPHDTARPLVIDPVLVSSTFLGGSGVDSCYGIAVDNRGSIYVTGYTESTDFPTLVPIQPALSQSAGVRTDAFVAKLDRTGTTLLFATFLGGGGRDTGYAIAIGPDGGVFVSGSTESVDFPAFGSVQPAFGGGPSDAFLVKLNPAGASLQFATTIGGTGIDGARGLAVDSGGNAVVTGSTTSVDFPTVAPVQPRLGGQTDAFVAKLAPTGLAFAYSTYLGGSADEHGLGVAVDGVGDAYVTGDTSSPNFPTVRPIQPRYGGTGPPDAGGSTVAGDAFLTRLDRAGSSFVFSTYLGGRDSDGGAGVALDTRGNAYLTGTTSSTNFPVVKPHQPRNGGEFDAFVAQVAPGGASLTYATYLGGGASEGGTAVAVDTSGKASVVGATASSDFPVASAIQSTKSGGFVDGFLTTMSAGGADLDLSTYVGGNDEDQVTAVSLDGDGIVHLAGYTNSGDFPVERALRPTKTGPVGDAFVMRVDEAAGAGAAGSAGAGFGRDTRVRLLIGTTVALLLAAAVMTLWLRRHPTPATAGPVGTVGTRVPPTRPREDKVFPSLQPVSPERRAAPVEPPAQPARSVPAGPERPLRAGDTGPERPLRAGDTGPERPLRAGDTGPASPSKLFKSPKKRSKRSKVGRSPAASGPARPAKAGAAAPVPGVGDLSESVSQGPSGPTERGAEAPSGPTERGAQGPSGPTERGAQAPSGPTERGAQAPSGPTERGAQGPTAPPLAGGGPGEPGADPPNADDDYDRWFESLVSDDPGSVMSDPPFPAVEAESEWWKVDGEAGLPTDRPERPVKAGGTGTDEPGPVQEPHRPAEVPDAELPAPELGEHEMAAWELLISAPAPSEPPAEHEVSPSVVSADDWVVELLHQEPETASPGPSGTDASGDEDGGDGDGGEGVSDLWSEELPIPQSAGDAAREDWLRTLWAEDLPVPNPDTPPTDAGGTPPHPQGRETE